MQQISNGPEARAVPPDLLIRFAAAVEQRRGAAFAELFCADAVYHDCFHGPFTGRTEIATLIDDWFYRTACDFRWTFHDPVGDGATLYARYAFSYRSILEGAPEGRVGFEGVAILRLRDGLIREYREVANTGPVLAALNFHPDRVAKILQKANRQVWDSAEFQAHRSVAADGAD